MVAFIYISRSKLLLSFLPVCFALQYCLYFHPVRFSATANSSQTKSSNYEISHDIVEVVTFQIRVDTLTTRSKINYAKSDQYEILVAAGRLLIGPLNLWKTIIGINFIFFTKLIRSKSGLGRKSLNQN